LRLVFNETQIMGCTLGPISGPRAEVVLQLHPFIIHPLSTDRDCYKTELFSRFGDWGDDILTEDDIENSVNVLQSKIIAA
jgi:hypothetical protein